MGGGGGKLPTQKKGEYRRGRERERERESIDPTLSIRHGLLLHVALLEDDWSSPSLTATNLSIAFCSTCGFYNYSVL